MDSKRKQCSILERVQLYRKMEMYDVAETTILQQLSTHPDAAQLHFELGRIYHLQSKFAEALKSFESAASYNPSDPAPSLAMAITLLDIGCHEDAHKIIEDISKTTSREGADLAGCYTSELHRLHALLGQTYLKRGDKLAAKEHLEKALKMRPDDIDTRLQLADHLLENESIEMSLMCIEDGLKSHPTSSRLKEKCSILLFLQGEKSKSTSLANQALELDPSNVGAKAILKTLHKL